MATLTPTQRATVRLQVALAKAYASYWNDGVRSDVNRESVESMRARIVVARAIAHLIRTVRQE